MLLSRSRYVEHSASVAVCFRSSVQSEESTYTCVCVCVVRSAISRSAHVFKKPRRHLKILDAIMKPSPNWHTADPPILVATVHNLVALVTWSCDLCTIGSKINSAGYSGSSVSLM